ncbi:MAG: replication protein [Chloroflexota bacterium]
MRNSEGGFRRIENSLFEALIGAKLSGSAYAVLLVVIDRTIGFRRQSAGISLSHFQGQTGLSRQSVQQAIRRLEREGFLKVVRDSTRRSCYSLASHTDWQTGKGNHPSSLGKKITLDWERKSP